MQQRILVILPCEDVIILCHSNSPDEVTNPLPLFFIAYAIRPPSVHTNMDNPSVQLFVLRLFVQDMKQKTRIQSFQSKFWEAFHYPRNAKIIVICA